MGQPYKGPESDVWALGVLLYTLLFGEVAFSSPEQICNQRMTKPTRPCSEAVSDLLEWMLCKEPLHRPDTASILQHRWVFSPKPNNSVLFTTPDGKREKASLSTRYSIPPKNTVNMRKLEGGNAYNIMGL
jgi:serine/threonine protein kinase